MRSLGHQAGAEVADKYAKSLSESTDLDPVVVKPRGLGFFAVEGFDGPDLKVRALFSPTGGLFGAWDPSHLTDACTGCGARPAIGCCELGRNR